MEKYSCLEVYQPVQKKIRVGRNNDGGYVICDLGQVYDVFLSGGISNDISFEQDFLNLNPNIQCYAFDGTISKTPLGIFDGQDQWIPVKDRNHDWVQVGNLLHSYGTSHLSNFGVPMWSFTRAHPQNRKYIAVVDNGLKFLSNPDTLTWKEATNKYSNIASMQDIINYYRINFIKKNLGKENNDKISNLSEYFSKYNNIFMKMDIEGGEIDLFDSISDENLKKIKQLVIEYHSPDKLELPTRLAKTHWLVHFHGNNYQKTVLRDGITIPQVFECTYIRKEEGEKLSLNKTPIPMNLDQPNLSSKEDIILSGFPYSN